MTGQERAGIGNWNARPHFTERAIWQSTGEVRRRRLAAVESKPESTIGSQRRKAEKLIHINGKRRYHPSASEVGQIGIVDAE